jgi:hypothetical protein
LLKRRLATLSDILVANPAEPAVFAQFEVAVRLARSLHFEVDLWHAQNVCYRVLQEVCGPDASKPPEQEWLQRWVAIAEKLNLKWAAPAADAVPPPLQPVPQAA